MNGLALFDRIQAKFRKKNKNWKGYTHEIGGFSEPDYVSGLLNWLIVDPSARVVFGKDASLLGILKFRGPDMDSSTRNELIAYNAQLNSLIKSLGTGYSLWFEAQRHIADTYDKSKIDSSIVQLMEDERSEYYGGSEHFETDFYLSIYLEPPQMLKHKIFEALYEDEKNEHQHQKEDLKIYLDYMAKFRDVMIRFQDLLSRVMPEVHILDAQEICTYLHNCVSPVRHEIRPDLDRYLCDYLFEAPGLTAGQDMMIGNKHVRIITSLSTFPVHTAPGFMDMLNSINMEYRWVSRFICLSKLDAQRELERIEKEYAQTAKSIVTMFKEAITQEENPNDIDESAIVDKEDASQALLELNQDFVGYGYYTVTIQIMDDDAQKADEKAAKMLELLYTRGFSAYIEGLNNLEAWWGSLPGHFRANVRRSLVSTLTACHFMPMTALWPGDERNHFLKGPVLLYTDTNGFTPFRLSLHVGEVGHTMIVGPSGSGKSVLLNTIEAHFLKYPQSQVFIFDKSASSRALTYAVGGNFYNLAAEDNGQLSFQPLANVEDDVEIIWCKQWLLSYLRQQNVQIGPKEDAYVWQALLSMRTFDKSLHTISNFCDIVQDKNIRLALESLTVKGSYGKLFDNSVDISGKGRWQVFEMETLMNQPEIVPITLDYLFHNIERTIAHSKGPSIIVLDECWLFLSNETFSAKLKEYFKDMRKKNTSIIIATQNLTDIAEKRDLLNVVKEQCMSKIFLPNINATTGSSATLYEDFGCNYQQIGLIRSMTPKQDYYYMSERGNRVFQLALRASELPFVTATAKQDQQKIIELIGEHPEWLDDPYREEYISAWYEYKGFPEEATRYRELVKQKKEEFERTHKLDKTYNNNIHSILDSDSESFNETEISVSTEN